VTVATLANSFSLARGQDWADYLQLLILIEISFGEEVV
jgi:hypothetical protein